jgi:hypothetical protein
LAGTRCFTGDGQNTGESYNNNTCTTTTSLATPETMILAGYQAILHQFGMNYTVLGNFRTKTDMAKKRSSNAKSSSTKSRGRSEYYIISNLCAISQTTESGSMKPLQKTSFVNHC